MEKKSPLHIVDRNNSQSLVESGSGLVVFEQQALVHPEEYNKEDASYWIQYWQARAIHQARPQIGKNLCINVVT